MRSEKKKNKLQNNVLIVFKKGIAASYALEPAMLFSNAGFNTYSLFFEEAEKWVSPYAIKEITGKLPYGKHHAPPKSVFSKNFCLTLVINAETKNVNNLFSSNISNKSFCNYILQNCKNYFLLCSNTCVYNKDNINFYENNSFNQNIITYKLPDNVVSLSNFYKLIFSDTIKFLYNFALYKLTFFAERQNFNKNSTINNLIKELYKKGILFTNNIQEANLIIKSSYTTQQEINRILQNKKTQLALIINENSISDDFNRQEKKNGCILIQYDKKGNIFLKDDNTIRLLPNLSAQNSNSKLTDYLLNKLSILKNSVGLENND